MSRFVKVTIAVATVVLTPVAAVGAPHPPSTKPRPHSEHVPTSVHKVKLKYQKDPEAVGSSNTVHGDKAHRLVHTFDQLKREPKGRVSCDIAGGPTETVIFKSHGHTWKATQNACSDVRVVRDGKVLPTLLPNRSWDEQLRKDRK